MNKIISRYNANIKKQFDIDGKKATASRQAANAIILKDLERFEKNQQSYEELAEEPSVEETPEVDFVPEVNPEKDDIAIRRTTDKYEDIYGEEVKKIITVVQKYEEKYEKKIPVILAGGIYDHADYERAFSLGADGVQIATRFVTTEECDADERYKQTYIQAEKEDIVIVKSPVGMPGRAIRNTFLDKVKSEGRIPPTKCLRCIHTCNPAETPYCITEALIHADKGEVDQALLFCGGRAYEAKTIETVKKVIDYFCSSCI